VYVIVMHNHTTHKKLLQQEGSRKKVGERVRITSTNTRADAPQATQTQQAAVYINFNPLSSCLPRSEALGKATNRSKQCEGLAFVYA